MEMTQNTLIEQLQVTNLFSVNIFVSFSAFLYNLKSTSACEPSGNAKNKMKTVKLNVLLCCTKGWEINGFYLSTIIFLAPIDIMQILLLAINMRSNN